MVFTGFIKADIEIVAIVRGLDSAVQMLPAELSA